MSNSDLARSLMTHEDLEALTSKHELLTDLIDPACPLSLERCNAILPYLDACRRTKQVLDSPYSLKHVIESAGGPYVTDAELVAAALFLGFKIKPDAGSALINAGTAEGVEYEVESYRIDAIVPLLLADGHTVVGYEGRH